MISLLGCQNDTALDYKKKKDVEEEEEKDPSPLPLLFPLPQGRRLIYQFTCHPSGMAPDSKEKENRIRPPHPLLFSLKSRGNLGSRGRGREEVLY